MSCNTHTDISTISVKVKKHFMNDMAITFYNAKKDVLELNVVALSSPLPL